MSGEKIGSGRRFTALENSLRKSGAKNPAALAAHIGRKKYGAKRMAQLAAAGKRRPEEPDAPPVKPGRRTKI